MRIGVLKETFIGEGRVAATPSAARALIADGHAVLVEQGAGAVSGFPDDAYIQAGAEIAPTAEELYDRAEALWKVLPPSPHEARLLRPGQRLLALLHRLPGGVAAPVPEGVRAVDLLRGPGADSPVRAAMSEIAGRLAVEAASHALQQPNGGRGLLLGGVAGVDPAEVVVIGAGVAGSGAAALAAAVGASVRVLDVDVTRLRALASRVPGARTSIATPASIERALAFADVVIAAVREGSDLTAESPRVATRSHLALMQPGAVVVDLSIADGGAFASTPLTDLERPAEEVDGVVHIGVPNFAGAVPRTASLALAQAALPVVRAAVRGA